MNYNRLRHQNTFSEVWAILRQPSTAWIVQHLLPHIQDADRRPGYLEKKPDKPDLNVLKYK